MVITAKVNFTSEDSENGFVYGTSFDITVEKDISEFQFIAEDIAKQLNSENHFGVGDNRQWNFHWNVHKNVIKKKKEGEVQKNENTSKPNEFGKPY
jgi:hypothetical protein